MTKQYTLSSLGWRAFFQQQLSIDEVEQSRPARVLTVQRSGITVGDTQGERHIALASKWFSVPAEQRPAIGDWVLLSEQGDAVTRVLERCSVFTRVDGRREDRSAGDRRKRRHAVRRHVVQRGIQSLASRTLPRAGDGSCTWTRWWC